jgi:glyoxylase I family protein
MLIEHVLAVVPVSELERADAWYEAVFGRPADNRPMPSLVEWQVTGAGWVQVTVDTDRAGSGLLNLAVDDLAATRDELATRGVGTGEIQSASVSDDPRQTPLGTRSERSERRQFTGERVTRGRRPTEKRGCL